MEGEMIPPSVIARMASLGLNEDQARAVAEMMAAVEDATEAKAAAAISARRENDRERKARQRHGTAREVTGQHVTSADNPSSVLLPRDNNSTLNSTPSPKSSLRSDLSTLPAKPKSGNRGCRLPSDWKPDDAGRSLAAELLGNSGARAELDRFRDYWTAQPGARGVKADWDATWRNWVRKASETPAARAGPGARKTGRDVFAEIAFGGLGYDEFTDGTMGQRGGLPGQANAAGDGARHCDDDEPADPRWPKRLDL
jgi:hypothetical protein